MNMLLEIWQLRLTRTSVCLQHIYRNWLLGIFITLRQTFKVDTNDWKTVLRIQNGHVVRAHTGVCDSNYR